MVQQTRNGSSLQTTERVFDSIILELKVIFYIDVILKNKQWDSKNIHHLL